MLKELGVKPKDRVPIWLLFISVDMLSVEIAETAENVTFDARIPIRSCKSFEKPQFVRLALRPVQSVQGHLAALRASEELMAMIAAKQQNEPSVITFGGVLPVLAELGA
jgi:hypothetical protein